MTYGKIVNGQFVKAPATLHYGGRVYYNPPEKVLIEAGYTALLEAEYPKESAGDGYTYTKKYEQVEDYILASWELEDLGEQSTSDKETLYKQYIRELIREKYSVEDELALLRQKEQKPIEFAEYDSYVENCKMLAKQKIYGAESV